MLASSGVGLAILIFILYFAPTAIGALRHHHNIGSIFVINLLLGWTFIGWVVALAMACSAVRAVA